MKHIDAVCPECKSDTKVCYRPSGHIVFGKEWHMAREDATAILNKDHCEKCRQWIKTRKLVVA